MKERLDLMVLGQGCAESREKARILIMEGKVFVNGTREDKPGSMFDPSKSTLTVNDTELRYVSRGGYKLEKALASWPFVLTGRTCMDVGSSTGGFTDCMLQNGASYVIAVDVGTNQLAWKLREDPRVLSMEKTNVRYLTPEALAEKTAAVPDFVSIDVAFISLSKVLPAVKLLAAPDMECVCLVKPQFEAGREKVGKKGVVRDPAVHEEVIRSVALFASAEGFLLRGLTFSPIRGPEGNIEYLLYLSRGSRGSGSVLTPEALAELVPSVVLQAHSTL